MFVLHLGTRTDPVQDRSQMAAGKKPQGVSYVEYGVDGPRLEIFPFFRGGGRHFENPLLSGEECEATDVRVLADISDVPHLLLECR